MKLFQSLTSRTDSLAQIQRANFKVDLLPLHEVPDFKAIDDAAGDLLKLLEDNYSSRANMCIKRLATHSPAIT